MPGIVKKTTNALCKAVPSEVGFADDSNRCILQSQKLGGLKGLMWSQPNGKE